jgi:hypothetical protein
MSDFDVRPFVASSSVALVERLVARVPALRPVRDEHVADNGMLLPHVCFGDVTRWVVADFEGGGEGWREVLAFLEDAYPSEGYDAQAVIEQSLIENLPYPGQEGYGIERHLGPRLRAIYDEQRPGL